MRLRSSISSTLAIVAGLGLAATAHAAVGAGKSQSDITSAAACPGCKSMGKMQSKPSDSKPGKPWTGGGITTFKFTPATGDPLKPGLATGTYVVIIETSASPGGGVQFPEGGVKTYARFSYDAATKKCTFAVHPTVDTGSPSCGGPGQAMCSPAAVDKCSFTNFQQAGLPNILQVADGAAQAARIRVATLPPASVAGCPTGTVIVAGAELFPNPGVPSNTCETGTVVGVGGTSSGNVCNSGESGCP